MNELISEVFKDEVQKQSGAASNFARKYIGKSKRFLRELSGGDVAVGKSISRNKAKLRSVPKSAPSNMQDANARLRDRLLNDRMAGPKPGSLPGTSPSPKKSFTGKMKRIAKNNPGKAALVAGLAGGGAGYAVGGQNKNNDQF